MKSATQTLRELFEAAVALAPTDRAAFLDAHCRDPAQRIEVESLLAADADADEPLATGAVDRMASAIGTDDAAQPLPPGSQIGTFQLLDVLGEGGSSTVFRAARDVEGAIQQVALKLMRRGLYSPEAQRLFRREQRALIQLRHPNIAQMIEGGVTDTALPYIALELVSGTPITDHAEQHQLGLRQRLKLFVIVCQAVDAAHRGLIVHRDLKPSNVLVTDEGEVKLLDFGIAKLLADEDDDSVTQMPAFTPAYAAPEQRDGGVITTATDVYALGVLLGELVTGERVNDGSGRTPSSWITIRETSAADASATVVPITRRQVRGDLDAIILKALDTDPSRRHASAGRLADDIERLLAGRPVSAQPATGWYRTRKFVLRHKGGVATTVAFLLAIFSALGIALWQSEVAQRAAVHAQEQTRRAEASRDFLLSVFNLADTDAPPDKRPTLEQLVDDASATTLANTDLSNETRVDFLLTLARVDMQLGAYEPALAMLDRVDRSSPTGPETRLRATLLRASTFDRQSKPKQVLALLAPLQEKLAARSDAAAVDGLVTLANAISTGQGHDAANPVYQQARATARKLADDEAAPASQRVDVAEVRSLMFAERPAEALLLGDAVWQRWGMRTGVPNRALLDLLGSISIAAEMTGDLPRADRAYRDAIEVAERLYVRPHPATAWAIGIYGSYLVAKARYAEAEPFLERALAMRRSLLGEAHPDTLNGMAAMGRLRAGQLRSADANRWFADGVALCERYKVRHVVCPRLLGALSQMQSVTGDLDGAIMSATSAVAEQRALSGEHSPQMIGVLGQLARAQVKRGKYNDALPTTDEIAAIAQAAGSSAFKDAHYARFQRALALFALKRDAESLALIDTVVADQKKSAPDDTRALFSMLVLQARAMSRAQRFDEAKRVALEALAIEQKPSPLPVEMLAGVQRLAVNGRGY